MTELFLLLGSNIGDKRNILRKALWEIEQRIGEIYKTSGLYETEPWGMSDQENFVNQMVVVKTELEGAAILQTVLDIELKLGRHRKQKWGPRTIDIDIIYIGSEIIVSPELKVPHPEIENRKFTLIPLCEIAGSFIHPVLNITSLEMLSRCEDTLKVTKIS